MSTTTLERSPSADNNAPHRFDLSQEYVDSVFASMTTPLIAEGVGQNIPQDLHDTTQSPEFFVSPEGAPTGFPTTEQAEAEIAAREQLGDMKFSMKQLAKSGLGFPTYIATIGYAKLYDKSVNNWDKFQSKSAVEKLAHIEKMGKLGGNIGMLGATGLTLTLIGRLSGIHPLDAMHGLFDQPQPKAYIDPNHIKLANVTAALDPNGEHPVSGPDFAGHAHSTEWANDINTFRYNPQFDPAMAASGKHLNDFGVALQADPLDAQLKQPSGLYDLVRNRWTHSPKELATVLSKMGKIPNDAASINKIADGMTDPKNGPIFFQQGYKTALDILAHSHIEEKPITSAYGSYYIVDDGHGHLTIAYDNFVDRPNERGTMFVITTPDGKTICLRKECGGQPIDFIPASPEVQHYASAQNQPTYVPEKQAPAPQHENPSTPSNPLNPDTPNNPNNPDHQTPYVKGPGHANEFVTPMGSGDLKTPDPVVSEVTTPARNNIGVQRNAIVDGFLNAVTRPNDPRTGVSSQNKAPHLDTAGGTSTGAANETFNGSLSNRP